MSSDKLELFKGKLVKLSFKLWSEKIDQYKEWERISDKKVNRIKKLFASHAAGEPAIKLLPRAILQGRKVF